MIFCTVVAKSNLPLARVISRSLREHNPEAEMIVLLADTMEGIDPAGEPFKMVSIEDLRMPMIRTMCFRYPKLSLTFALYPFLMTWLFSKGYESAVYIKQESIVLGDLSPLMKMLRENSIFLTPHLIMPLKGNDSTERELTILRAGSYNGGLVGVANDRSGRDFLSWFKDRLTTHCLLAVAEGMHYEQRWLDLVPGMFDGVLVLRDPGYNIGHWSLPERKITAVGGRYTVDGRPLRLFRFSGYIPEDPDHLTKYTRKLRSANLGDAAGLMRKYHNELIGAGWEKHKDIPYGFDHFDNGVPIPEIARQLYREENRIAERFIDPFRTAGRNTFYSWLKANIWDEIYQRRKDLQKEFPDVCGNDKNVFIDWIRKHGAKEYNVREELLPHSGS